MIEGFFRMRVAQDRVGVLIGPKGRVKSRIEEIGGVKMTVDSETGETEVRLKDSCDPLLLLKVKNVVTAISRGFSPEKAFELFDDETLIDVIDLKSYMGKSESGIRRVKARLIGTGGKTWKIIEESTKARLSVYGHTVSIIGDFESHRVAKQAIVMLLEGCQHSTVYRYLSREAQRRKRVEAQIGIWEPVKRFKTDGST